MGSKFDRMPKGDRENENLKSYTPGEDMFGKGYLKDFPKSRVYDGHTNVEDEEKQMEKSYGKMPTIFGED